MGPQRKVAGVPEGSCALPILHISCFTEIAYELRVGELTCGRMPLGQNAPVNWQLSTVHRQPLTGNYWTVNTPQARNWDISPQQALCNFPPLTGNLRKRRTTHIGSERVTPLDSR